MECNDNPLPVSLKSGASSRRGIEGAVLHEFRIGFWSKFALIRGLLS